jgi:hypothetical protein
MISHYIYVEIGVRTSGIPPFILKMEFFCFFIYNLWNSIHYTTWKKIENKTRVGNLITLEDKCPVISTG